MPIITHKVINHLSTDPLLKNLINQIEIESDDEYVDVFVYLVRSIVSQQLSIKSAASIYNRLIHHEDIDPIDPHSFIRVPIEELRNVGLSFQKANYVKNVCQFFIENSIAENQWKTKSNEEIIEMLTSIKGVGVWTVQMVLMFALHRPDVFPVVDLGIQMGIKSLYGLKSEKTELKKEIEIIAKPWSPYRTMACLYIWRYKDTNQ